MMELTENTESRRTVVGKNNQTESVTKIYVLTGTSDELAAKQFVKDEVDSTYQIQGLLGAALYLPRSRIELEPEWTDTDADTGKWDITVQYEYPGLPEGSTFAFDAAGGIKHITQSKETISKHGPGVSEKLKGAIGFDGERVQGVDITVPIYQFSETHKLSNSVVTQAYKQIIFRLTGTVNDGAFKGFEAGEVLFLGAAGTKRGNEQWEVTFKFAASPNETGLFVGDIGPIEKKGWQYMWVQYAPVEDPAVHKLLKEPVAVYIERVYEDGIFGLLNIGT